MLMEYFEKKKIGYRQHGSNLLFIIIKMYAIYFRLGLVTDKKA